MPSVAVFIDYENVHRVGHHLFAQNGAPLWSTSPDPIQLAELLVERKGVGFNLEGIYVFRGRPVPSRQARAAAENDTLASRWERDSRVKVIRRDLQYVSNGSGFTAHEKGIDVAFAVTLVEVAIGREFDVAIAVTTDTDLVPALELVFFKTPVHLELATWEGARPLWFKEFLIESPPRRLPFSHRLSPSDFAAVSPRLSRSNDPR